MQVFERFIQTAHHLWEKKYVVRAEKSSHENYDSYFKVVTVLGVAAAGAAITYLKNVPIQMYQMCLRWLNVIIHIKLGR